MTSRPDFNPLLERSNSLNTTPLANKTRVVVVALVLVVGFLISPVTESLQLTDRRTGRPELARQNKQQKRVSLLVSSA